jgi:hypothetical protein
LPLMALVAVRSVWLLSLLHRLGNVESKRPAHGLLQLGAHLHALLHFLHSDLMTLQSLLDRLNRLTFTLGQLFQLLGVLLLLLQHLLVHLVGLLRLLHQLGNDLLALVDLRRNILHL